MEDVSIRIHSGRALLDSANTWASGPVRNPAEVAASPIGGEQRDIRPAVEKSPEDACIGSLPFDYSILGNSGCAPDPGSDEPSTDLIQPISTLDSAYEKPILIQQEQEIRQEMQSTQANPQVSLVKANQVKALALALMADRFSFNGKPKFTRVSPAFVDSVEHFVYAALVNAIRRHPSIGKVIKDF